MTIQYSTPVLPPPASAQPFAVGVESAVNILSAYGATLFEVSL